MKKMLTLIFILITTITSCNSDVNDMSVERELIKTHSNSIKIELISSKELSVRPWPMSIYIVKIDSVEYIVTSKGRIIPRNDI